MTKANDSQKQAMQALDVLWREQRAMERELGSDLARFSPRAGRNSRQTSRRAYVRSVLAFIEAHNTWLSRYVLTAWDSMISDEERLLLRNRRIFVDRSGNPVEVRDNRTAAEQMWDAFDLYADTWGARTPIVRASKEWNLLQVLVKVRNRITHPSTAADLMVDTRELRTAWEVERWVHLMISELFRECATASMRKLDALHRAAKRAGIVRPRSGRKSQSGRQLALELPESSV